MRRSGLELRRKGLAKRRLLAKKEAKARSATAVASTLKRAKEEEAILGEECPEAVVDLEEVCPEVACLEVVCLEVVDLEVVDLEEACLAGAVEAEVVEAAEEAAEVVANNRFDELIARSHLVKGINAPFLIKPIII